ncbi:MAG: hypothetical protein RJB66_386 [Pseudomonadota bacterium]
MMKKMSFIALFLVCGQTIFLWAGEVKNPPLEPLLEGVGGEKVAAYCIICHSLEYIKTNAPVMNRAGWEKTVHKMVQSYGAPISEGDQKIIIDYLEAKYSDKK